MFTLLVGIVASTAISEALAQKLFHGKEVPVTQKNAVEGQRDGTGEEEDGGENEHLRCFEK